MTPSVCDRRAPRLPAASGPYSQSTRMELWAPAGTEGWSGRRDTARLRRRRTARAATPRACDNLPEPPKTATLLGDMTGSGRRTRPLLGTGEAQENRLLELAARQESPDDNGHLANPAGATWRTRNGKLLDRLCCSCSPRRMIAYA